MKDLLIRSGSGILGLFLLVAVIKIGSPILDISLMLLSLIGLNEYFKAIRNLDFDPNKTIIYLATIGLYITPKKHILLALYLILSLITLVSLLLILNNDYSLLEASLGILGFLYIPNLFNYLRLFDQKYIWLVFIISFGSDTFAYFIGNIFGKKKLAPKLSPNKTIEGSLGGIIGSILLTIIYIFYIGDINYFRYFIVISILVSIFSQLGDLVASKIKRIVGIKDYGNLIPGHGGVLDRFDSIIFSIPILFYSLKVFELIIH